MTAFRRNLRALATAWLVFQVVSLAAFVPRDCCTFHQRHQAHQQSDSGQAPTCHESADAGIAAHHEAGVLGQPTAPDCEMRGTCNGPLGMLATLLSNHAVIGVAVTLPSNVPVGTVANPVREHLASRLIPPDSPPPRA